MNNLKECKLCHYILPATEEYFYPHPTTVDKLENRCKKCKSDYYYTRQTIMHERYLSKKSVDKENEK